MVEAAGGVPLAAPTPKKTFLDLKTMDTISQQFGLYWPNFIAQVILFVIVYFVLRKYAFRPIVTMLEERRRRIEEGQLNAERIKKQLAEAQAKYEEILARANAESQRLIEEVRQSGDRLAEQKRQQAIAEAEQIMTKARESIEQERERTMVELKRDFGRLVVEVTEKVTKKALTPEDQQRINEEALRDLAA
jgi:F-type H+-transporting ATPase subunit b